MVCIKNFLIIKEKLNIKNLEGNILIKFEQYRDVCPKWRKTHYCEIIYERQYQVFRLGGMKSC